MTVVGNLEGEGSRQGHPRSHEDFVTPAFGLRRSGITARASAIRSLLIASRDRALVRRLTEGGHRDGARIRVTDRPSEVRDCLLSSGAACLVDGRDQDLVEAVGAKQRAATDDLLLHVAGVERPTCLPRERTDLVRDRLQRWGELPEEDPADRILGVSTDIDRVRDQVRSVAEYTDVAVLVLGATGTGKELVAQTIHELSFGSGAPFVAVNCAAIPEHLVESELFGHEAGAFTGARGSRIGLMEAAADGTLFLDEIAEMPLGLQGKLLRALESRRFRRVGANRDVELRARVVSATNRRVQASERLRKDLYFRLAGFTIRLPKLCERPVDVAVLASHFLRGFAGRYQRTPSLLLDPACDELEPQRWTGNCRELRTVCEHAAILAGNAPIEASHIRSALESRLIMPPSTLPPPNEPSSSVPPAPPEPRRLHEMERLLIERTLDECDGNVSQSARALGIPRSTLRDKLRRYDLS